MKLLPFSLIVCLCAAPLFAQDAEPLVAGETRADAETNANPDSKTVKNIDRTTVFPPGYELTGVDGLPVEIRTKIEAAVAGANDGKGGAAVFNGRIVIIGSDGKRQVVPLYVNEHQGILPTFLPGVPVDVQQEVEKTMKAAREAQKKAAKLKAASGIKIIRIGPDGKREEVAPADANNILFTLPPEAQQLMQLVRPPAGKPAQQPDMAQIAEQLERIAKRLDKIEADVKALREAE